MLEESELWATNVDTDDAKAARKLLDGYLAEEYERQRHFPLEP